MLIILLLIYHIIIINNENAWNIMQRNDLQILLYIYTDTIKPGILKINLNKDHILFYD